MSGIGTVIDRRTYGPFRDGSGDRTVVTLEVRQRDDGHVYASFISDVYRKHSSYMSGGGQWQGSAPRRLKDLWDRWHLNDMRAGCEHQRALGWTSYDDHPSEPCPECGYKFGSAWLFEPLPEDFMALCDSAAGVKA